MSCLESLPLEILEMIMNQIDTPRCLYNLIRSSPTALGLFLGRKRPILRAITTNAIPDEALPGADALVRLRRWQRSVRWARENKSQYRRMLQNHLFDHHDRRFQPLDLDNLDDIKALCRVLNMVDTFKEKRMGVMATMPWGRNSDQRRALFSVIFDHIIKELSEGRAPLRINEPEPFHHYEEFITVSAAATTRQDYSVRLRRWVI